MDELNALYNKMSVYGDTYGDTVAPDVPDVIEPIPDLIDPFILPTSQGGGGGGDGGWTADTNYGTFEKEYRPDQDYGEWFSGLKGTPSMSGYVKQKQPGLAELFEALKKNSLTSNIMKMGKTGIETAQNWYADKKAKEKIQKEKDLMAEIQADNFKAAMQAQQAQAVSAADLANIQQIQQHTGQGLSQYRMDRPASERQFTGAAPKGTTTFDTKSGMGRRDYAQGDRIRYGEGGIVTL